jgi:hypothetical protein
MYRVGVSVALALFAIALAIFSYNTPKKEASTAPTVPPTIARDSDDQSARLAARVDELQQSLTALKAQLVAQQNSHPVQRAAAAAGDAKPPDIPNVEAQRAADAERLREYMTGVHQAFANEKVDPAWSSRVSSRVSSTFEGDEMLRNIAHTVECRQQTCRVQIEDDGSGRLSSRMPFLTRGLADVLPQVSAERIEQPNGRGAMVLFMSSQRLAQPSR